jgi:hypothetical protein
MNDETSPTSPHRATEAYDHARILAQALSASKDKLQVCANILTVLDRLVDINSKIEQMLTAGDVNQKSVEVKTREKEAAARFDILRTLAQADDIAFRDILDKLTEHAINVTNQVSVDDRTRQVAARVVQLVGWQEARLKQGKDSGWNFKAYRSKIEKNYRVGFVFTRCAMLYPKPDRTAHQRFRFVAQNRTGEAGGADDADEYQDEEVEQDVQPS